MIGDLARRARELIGLDNGRARATVQGPMLSLARLVLLALALSSCGGPQLRPGEDAVLPIIHAGCHQDWTGPDQKNATTPKTVCWYIHKSQFGKLADSVPHPHGVQPYAYELDVIESRARELGSELVTPAWTPTIAAQVAAEVDHQQLIVPNAIIWVFTTSTALIPEVVSEGCDGRYEGACDPIERNTGRMIPHDSHMVQVFWRELGVKTIGAQ